MAVRDSFLSFKGPIVWQGMYRHEVWPSAVAAVTHVRAVLAGEATHTHGELTALDEFALSLAVSHAGYTETDVVKQWGVSLTIIHNACLLSTLFYVPTFYGCLSHDFIRSHTPIDIVAALRAAYFGTDQVVPEALAIIDCSESPIGAATGLGYEQSNTYSGKMGDHTQKTCVATTWTRVVLHVSPFYGGRISEVLPCRRCTCSSNRRIHKVYGTVAFLAHIPFLMLLLVDRGFRYMTVPDNFIVWMPSYMDGRRFIDGFESAVNTIMSSFRAPGEHVFGSLKAEIPVCVVCVRALR